MRIFSQPSVAAVALTCGCASITFSPKTASVGEFRDMRAVDDKAEDIGDASDVKAMLAPIPPELVACVARRERTVDCEILGEVEARYNNSVPTSSGFGSTTTRPASAGATRTVARRFR